MRGGTAERRYCGSHVTLSAAKGPTRRSAQDDSRIESAFPPSKNA
jgi:hypothetical protein